MVEPPKSQVRQLEKKKKQRAEIKKSLVQSSPGYNDASAGRGRGRGRDRTWRESPTGGYRHQEMLPMHDYMGGPGSSWGWEDPYAPVCTQ